MQLIDASTLTYHPFVSRDDAGAMYVSLPAIEFEIDSQYQIQVEAIVQKQRLKYGFQSLYLDASAITTGTTYITVGTTQQVVAMLAGYQGYRPLLVNPESQVFTFSNPGANAAGNSQILRAYLLNVTVTSTEWGTLAGSGSGGSGVAVWG